jgi:hypothetical protein
LVFFKREWLHYEIIQHAQYPHQNSTWSSSANSHSKLHTFTRKSYGIPNILPLCDFHINNYTIVLDILHFLSHIHIVPYRKLELLPSSDRQDSELSNGSNWMDPSTFLYKVSKKVKLSL